MATADLSLPAATLEAETALFAEIAEGLHTRGLAICPDALTRTLAPQVHAYLQTLCPEVFVRAAVGRGQAQQHNAFVRRDAIAWITGEDPVPAQWLAFAERLRLHLNRTLMLGLFSFESHFAHYRPGDFYRRHLDAFRGESNRILSVVAYFNPGWQPEDGGELTLWLPDGQTLNVTPALGTLVVFLSEEFPHEVRPALRDRYSIAGWYRLNTSTAERVDPPR